MTDFISALTAGVRETDGVKERAVSWMYQRTIPPLVKMVNKSNISDTSLLHVTYFLTPYLMHRICGELQI